MSTPSEKALDLSTTIHESAQRAFHASDAADVLIGAAAIAASVGTGALAIDALVAEARAEAMEECRGIAIKAHPEGGDCCLEDPDGHYGSVQTSMQIAEEIRALAAKGKA